MSSSSVLSDALHVLRRAGAHILDGNLDSLTLVLPDHHTITVEIKVWEGSIRPAPPEAPPPPARTLHIATTAAPHTVEAALAGDFELLTTDPAELIIEGTVLLTDRTPRHAESAARRGRTPWGKWAIERVLILSEQPLTQRTIAARTGLTPQAVSWVLRDHPTIERNNTGWTALSSLLDDWLTTYPGPRGHDMHWYSLDTPVDQATTAAAYATELDVHALVTGDVAADRYAPWRHPQSARIYIPEIIDFTPIGFTPATADQATLTTVIPTDPTLWRTADTIPHTRPTLADPVITLWDLLHTSTGPDTTEAADRIRDAITTKTAHG